MTTIDKPSKFIRFQRVRLERMKGMTLGEILTKSRDKARPLYSFSFHIRRIAFALEKFSLRYFPDAYAERPETGAINLEHKLERLKAGGPFEPYDVSLINKAATQLIGEAENILEVGCGTGIFAGLAAQKAGVHITASEFDHAALEWAKANRGGSNISFQRLSLDDCEEDAYDLVVAIEVIEHLSDYSSFLKQLSRVAPRALITTPNKNRSALDAVANTPSYDGHTREWTAGEFYWVLRTFWQEVQLYTLPRFQKQVSNYKNEPGKPPLIKPCSVLSREEPVLALCAHPRRDLFS